MPYLVLELQSAAMDRNRSVADVVRMALVVATKLNLADFKNWCEKELRGFEKEAAPAYRKVHGQLKAWNPYRGWIPVVVQERETMEQLSEREIGQPIAELEQLNSRGEDKTQMQVPLPHHILESVFGDTQEFQLGLVPTLLVDRSQVVGILDAIRNAVLTWSLDLEKQGVLGEGMTFSRAEVERAASVTYHIGTFAGVLGNVSGGNVQVGDYNSVHAALKELALPQKERNELEEIMDAMPHANAEKKASLARRGSDWLMRNAAAIGTLSEQIRKWFELNRPQ